MIAGAKGEEAEREGGAEKEGGRMGARETARACARPDNRDCSHVSPFRIILTSPKEHRSLCSVVRANPRPLQHTQRAVRTRTVAQAAKAASGGRVAHQHTCIVCAETAFATARGNPERPQQRSRHIAVCGRTGTHVRGSPSTKRKGAAEGAWSPRAEAVRTVHSAPSNGGRSNSAPSRHGSRVAWLASS